MKIVALETIKYKKVNRVPGTKSAVFECTKDIAEQLIKDGKACLPQTLEQLGKSSDQDSAAQVVANATAEAKKLVADAQKDVDQLKADAQAEVDKLKSDAQAEAASIIKKAKDAK